MIRRINDLLESNENFTFETTLATKSYKLKIEEAKRKNYTVILLFFWLQRVELAIERVIRKKSLKEWTRFMKN